MHLMSLHLLYRKAISTVCIFGEFLPMLTEKRLLFSWGDFQLPFNILQFKLQGKKVHSLKLVQ